jgi:hypothetical protein
MVEVVQATKVEAAEAETLDRAMMGVSINTPPGEAEAEVEGQYRYWKLVRCPWCRNVAWCRLDSSVYIWFTCCNCGRAFKA